jgi:DNA-binding transcriptional LysR family regulator
MGILRGTAELFRICGRMAISRVSSVVQRSSEKLGNSGFLVRSRDPIPIAAKLMIVAHPDDESLFGGEALTSSRGWLVVCVTNASHPTRRAEFVKAMSLAGADYLVLDHPDNIANGNFHPSLTSTLEGLLTEHGFEMVVTHGPNGEYGHRQHVALHQIVCGLVRSGRLFTFATRWSARPHMSAAKRALLECYALQDSVARFRYMAEREVLRPMSRSGFAAW